MGLGGRTMPEPEAADGTPALPAASCKEVVDAEVEMVVAAGAPCRALIASLWAFMACSQPRCAST